MGVTVGVLEGTGPDVGIGVGLEIPLPEPPPQPEIITARGAATSNMLARRDLYFMVLNAPLCVGGPPNWEGNSEGDGRIEGE